MIYNTLEELALLLDKAAVEPHKELVLENSLPGVFLQPRAGSSGMKPAGVVSKLGGMPDLPLNFPWPRCDACESKFAEDFPAQEAGASLHFIMQIDCNQLAVHGLSFPRDHVLSFFAALHRAGFPNTGGSGDDWYVGCFPARDTAPRLAPAWSGHELGAIGSEGNEFIAEGRATITEKCLEIQSCFTLPVLTLERDPSVAHLVESDSWKQLRESSLRLRCGILMGGNLIHAATTGVMHLVDLAEDFSRATSWGRGDTQHDACEEWVNLACIPTIAEINLT